ncbi:hypothetical protein HY972_02325 [Candidatus Kaiserbacteria bacterium]|nr:hypothetical protein [Candidatus Kaiserbacteria bacterium]
MNKYIYATGAFALALAMNGLPFAALAESNGEGGTDAPQTQRVGEAVREQQKQNAEAARERQDQFLKEQKGPREASSSSEVGEGADKQEIDLEFEDDEDQAYSVEDLKQKIEVRKHELDQEVASTSPDHQDIVENANPVRLAVHALLASKELVGGIGPQVSEIAKQMNDSVATTANVEAKIQGRGFLTRLLFGGDSAAADVIAQQVAQNQQRIDDLTKLLGEANVPADIQATLTAQIAAIQAAQQRLRDLAQKEQDSWGLFSWRF